MKLIKYKKRILIFSLAVLLLMPFSLALAEEKKESFEELSIKLKALQTATQAGEYLKNNPNLTIKELQADPAFKKLAVQQVGETGYTALIDVNSGYFYFHPQEALVNTDAYALKDNLPDWWEIIGQTIGDECRESSGLYNWQEDDGSITEKYMYLACVDGATADGKNLFVGATTYLDEIDALKYLEKYEIKKYFVYAKDAIKQKAEDIAKQIEIYIKLNPDKTVEDLQADQYFQEIAVQEVGETGYTAVTDYNTLINRFHKNPDIVDLDLSVLADKLPGFWSIMSMTEGGKEAEGMYDWKEADGSIEQKYIYIALVDAKTADNIGLSVAATAYLDEYEESEDSAIGEKNYPIIEPQSPGEEEIDLVVAVYWFLGGLAIVFFISFIFNRLGVIRIEKNIVFYLLAAVSLIVIGLFVFSTWQITQDMKKETITSAVEALSAVAVSRTEHVNTLTDSYKAIATALAVGNVFKDTVDESIDYNTRIERAEKRTKLTIEANPQISRIRVLDKEGNVIAPSIEDNIVGNEDVFAKVKEKIFIGEASVLTRTGQKVINVSSPILLNEKFAGVLVITYGLEEISKVVENIAGLGETGETYLINKDKYMITSSRFTKDVFLKQKIDSINSRKCFEHAKETRTEHAGVVEFINYQGVRTIGAHSYIPEAEWCLLAERNEQEVMVNINEDIRKTWIFTFGIIGLIMIIGIAFNFLLTKSLKREVADKTEEVKENSRVIIGQLKKEEKISMEKEKLLKEQKKAKIDLENKVDELEKFQKLTVGRELKMIELKKKIKDLEKE